MDVNVIFKVHCEMGSAVYEETGHLHTKESLKTLSSVSLAAWPQAQKWDVSCLPRTAQILGTGIHSSSTCQGTHLSFLWRWKLLSFWTSDFTYLCLTLTWGDATKPSYQKLNVNYSNQSKPQPGRAKSAQLWWILLVLEVRAQIQTSDYFYDISVQ